MIVYDSEDKTDKTYAIQQTYGKRHNHPLRQPGQPKIDPRRNPPLVWRRTLAPATIYLDFDEAKDAGHDANHLRGWGPNKIMMIHEGFLEHRWSQMVLHCFGILLLVKCVFQIEILLCKP